MYMQYFFIYVNNIPITQLKFLENNRARHKNAKLAVKSVYLKTAQIIIHLVIVFRYC